MKVGLVLPGVQSIELNESLMRAAEAMGADSAWFADHLLGVAHPGLWPEYAASTTLQDPDSHLDPFILAGMLGRNSRLSFGTSVTDGTRRRGGDLARTVLTLNAGCKGGFILGIGAGEAESLLPFGYDMSKPVGRLEETLRDLRALLDTGSMPDGALGRTGLRNDAPAGPAQVWVAATRARSLELAARYGDGWLSQGISLQAFGESLQQLDALTHRLQRPPLTAAMMPVILLGDSRAHTAEILARNPLPKLLAVFWPAALWRRYGLEHPCGPDSRGTLDAMPHGVDPARLRQAARDIPFEMFDETVLCGNAAEIAQRLRPYADAGLEHVALADLTGLSYPAAECERLMSSQLPELFALLRKMTSGRKR